MTRRDFELIAKVIRNQRRLHLDMCEPVGAMAVDELAGEMATHLGNEHPRFDRERFLTACGRVTA